MCRRFEKISGHCDSAGSAWGDHSGFERRVLGFRVWDFQLRLRVWDVGLEGLTGWG